MIIRRSKEASLRNLQRCRIVLLQRKMVKGADLRFQLPATGRVSCAATRPLRDYSQSDKDHSTETRMIFYEVVSTLRSQAAQHETGSTIRNPNRR